VLFSLIRDSSRIITNWNRLLPKLADNPAADGLCFKLQKKKKHEDL
jgi:hypothetical protein